MTAGIGIFGLIKKFLFSVFISKISLHLNVKRPSNKKPLFLERYVNDNTKKTNVPVILHMYPLLPHMLASLKIKEKASILLKKNLKLKKRPKFGILD